MSAASDEAMRRWPKPAPETRRLSEESFEHPDIRYGFEQGARWATMTRSDAVELLRAAFGEPPWDLSLTDALVALFPVTEPASSLPDAAPDGAD